MPNVINAPLLIRRQHFQQQTALGPSLTQRLQQPQLQLMVITIVMLLADDQPRRFSQPHQQFLRCHDLTAAQIPDFAADRRQRYMLASTQ
jgi:hypothetical protein